MDKYFNRLNSSLFCLLTEDEILKNSMWGENSQFIRINNSKIRQTGIVKDWPVSLLNNVKGFVCSFLSSKSAIVLKIPFYIFI